MVRLTIETQKLLDRADKAIAQSKQLLSERAFLPVRGGRYTAEPDFDDESRRARQASATLHHG